MLELCQNNNIDMSGNMHKLNDVIEHYKRHINRATESNDNEKVKVPTNYEKYLIN